MKRIIQNIISYIIYIFILMPCVISTIFILYQKIFIPNDIPNILGWKMFIVMDENIEGRVSSGDLAFVKITDRNELKEDDIVAFRNNSNHVSISQIDKIEYTSNQNNGTNKINLKDQVENVKNITDKNVEGVLKYRIPKLGSILYFILKPYVMITILGIILVGGTIAIHIAGKLDEKEINKSNQNNSNMV